MERKDTHANKAESYNIGRPNYPEVFYKYLYKEAGITTNTIIADIGAGTGKVTKGFLERGNKVFAIEPDKDMIKILKNNLNRFPDCIPIENTAENIEIPSNSIDLIFCGNSYHWFDKNRVIPVFKRILNNTNQSNIVITLLGPYHAANAPSPFKHDTFTSKIFEYTVYNGFKEYLHGSLSASDAPNPEDHNFEKYCESLKHSFEKHNINGKIEIKFKLCCMIGNVKNLI